MNSTSQFIQQAIPWVEQIFSEHGEGDIHGLAHALEVMDHAEKGLESYPRVLSDCRRLCVLMAALLHDVDDDKLFPEHRDYDNARMVMQRVAFPFVDLVLEMIGLVSFSKNGISDVYISKSKRSATAISRTTMYAEDINIFDKSRKHHLGTQHPIPKWKLIPRLADRVVALGTRGVGRCIGFGGQQGRPIYTQHTPRFSTEHELRIYAIRAWLGVVPSVPASSIDYFIRGLIPRCFMFSGIPYFDRLTINGTEPIVKLILLFGRDGVLTKESILKLVASDPEAVQMIQEYI